MKQIMALILVSLLLTVLGLSVGAVGGYALDWWTVDGGGGVSSGGNFDIQGTTGQPDAGVMSGGNFTVEGGFWGGVAVVTPPPPANPTVFLPLMQNN
jgi:hypothetical protein